MASQEAQLEQPDSASQRLPLPPVETQNLLKYLFKPPSIVFLTQRSLEGAGHGWQIGKTNTGFYFAETLQTMGIIRKIASNTPSLDGRVEFIDNFAALELWGDIDRSPKLFMWDDANQFLLFTETMSAMAKAIFKLAPTLSKSNMTVIIVLHEEELFVKRMLRSEAFIRGRIKKFSRTSAQALIGSRRYPLFNIPATSIKYDSLRKAVFSLEGTVGLFLNRTDYMVSKEWSAGATYEALKVKYNLGHDMTINRTNRRVMKALFACIEAHKLTPQLRGFLESEEKLEEKPT